MQRIAQRGDTVQIHFVATLASGHKVDMSEISSSYHQSQGVPVHAQKQQKAVFDMSQTKPFTIILGQGEVIPGLEEGIMGMHVGEKRRIEIKPEKAYGSRQADLIAEVPTSNLPPMDHVPQKGEILQLNTQAGKKVFARLVDIRRESVIVDMNHPLAGHTLIYDVVLMHIL